MVVSIPTAICIFVSFFVDLLLATRFSSSQGEEKAITEYKNFTSANVSDSSLFSRKKSITINGTSRDGYVLSSSKSLMALYLLAIGDKKEKVVVVPHSIVSEITAVKN